MRDDFVYDAERLNVVRAALGLSDEERAAQARVSEGRGLNKLKAAFEKAGTTSGRYRDLMNAELPRSQPIGMVNRSVMTDTEHAFEAGFRASIPVGACLDLLMFGYRCRYFTSVRAEKVGDQTRLTVETGRGPGLGPKGALVIGILLAFLILPSVWAVLVVWADSKYRKLYHRRAVLPMLRSLGVVDPE